MTGSQQFSKRTVFWARAGFVTAGCVIIGLGTWFESFALAVIHFLGYGLQILGAMILGFGAFARGNLCAGIFLRLLHRLVG